MQIHELPTGTIGNTDKIAYDTGEHTYAVPYSEIKNGIITEAEGKAYVFTEAATRANINTGETRATIFGKIKKWFTDITPFIFESSDTYDLSSTKPYGMTTVRAKRKGEIGMSAYSRRPEYSCSRIVAKHRYVRRELQTDLSDKLCCIRPADAAIRAYLNQGYNRWRFADGADAERTNRVSGYRLLVFHRLGRATP